MKPIIRTTLLLLAFLLPTTAIAYDFEVDGIYYNIINRNEASVTYNEKEGTDEWSHNTYSGDVIIPSTVTYNGTTYSLIAIGEYAFCNCSGLTSVTIPNSVTSIGYFAFGGCSGLTNVTIPNSVTTIGYRAFIDCCGLLSVEIPNSVTSIGCEAFYGTAWYNNQPDGLVYAGLVAYEYKGTMPEGTSITIREGTLSITDLAFSNCSGLTSVTIPNSVTSIGECAFSDCSGMTSVTIGNSVTIIGDCAFYNCSGLTSITIPDSVTEIGDYAFYGCLILSSVFCKAKEAPIIYEHSFPDSFDGYYDNYGNMGESNVIYISSDSRGYDSWHFKVSSAFQSGAYYLINPDYTTLTVTNDRGSRLSNNIKVSGVSYGGDVIIPSTVSFYGFSFTVTCINNQAFESSVFLTSVSIPSTVISIADGAFVFCQVLESMRVDSQNPIYDSRDSCNAIIKTATNTLIAGCKNTTIPNSVTSIGDYAFTGCSGLTSVTIPNSVTTIGYEAFSGCSGLTSVTIPNSVTTIGNKAFVYCSGLTEIYSLAIAPPEISESTFFGYDYNCYQATLYVPMSSVEAYRSAEYWCNFTNIVGIMDDFIVNEVKYHPMDSGSASVVGYVEDEGYDGWELVIPETVTHDDFTFTVTEVADGAFDGCYDLASVVIGDGVESIGENAFQGCTALTSVTIGSGVISIGSKAFNYCNALRTVTCLGDVPPVMASTDCFTNAAYNRATLRLHRQVMDAYTAADYWYKFVNIEGYGSSGPGDVNGDGVINIADVSELIDYLLGHSAGDFYEEGADVNGNGIVNIADIAELIDLLLRH